MLAQYYAESGGGDDALILFCVGVGISSLIGMAIGGGKGKAMEGFFLGLLLGPIGWIISAVSQPSDKIRHERLAEQAHVQAQAILMAGQQVLSARGRGVTDTETHTKADTNAGVGCLVLLVLAVVVFVFQVATGGDDDKVPTRTADTVSAETGLTLTEAWCKDVVAGKAPLGMMMGAVDRGVYPTLEAAAQDAYAMTSNGCSGELATNRELQAFLASFGLSAPPR